ncbi:MAG TPA: response regulator transcription factor [Bryobacteraceae bacterium]|jgi:two-component system KDP operon response regulator KdpE|nr:response regulator transcription factor [Bryobacteraceae bacterium]
MNTVNASQGKVLIVDDEPSIRRAIRTTFGTLGFDITEAVTGEQALPLLRASNFDAVLLDVNMPGMGGLEACREIRRQFPRLAVLMLTVRDNEDDKVEALDAGADDYVTKPFPIRELVARVRAAVRRSHAPASQANVAITIGEITLDPPRRLVQKNGQAVHLTPKEFDLLLYLMKHAGLPMLHSRLLSAVWGPEYGNELEYLRTFIRQLRKKLEDDAAHPKYLLTDSHVGYRFRDV